ncbi:IclR family transcriptional regulator [Brachybacterium endophyticum]|uniref:Glycerol operon regulatory protein n=1 Tax=Brachybacterium endophyticum TaxID=2182385 RepID=A0A2U2RN92_9MICO|nr:IclR family transcriptional regulator [Brachybacterium endophyticum]PWH07311.1 IclR family transcriptional regulator [Brachybacterium endophyticum]
MGKNEGKNETPGTSASREVKSAARTLEVLEYLAGRQGTLTRLREVADALGAPRSSTYALLQTLVAWGWVQTEPTGTYYSIGIRALLAGISYIDRDPRVRLARPILADVCASLGETVHLARLDRDQVVYLATVESHEYTRQMPRVGRRLPAAHTSLGKAILAERPEDVPGEMPAPLTRYSHTSLEELQADLALARDRGYAVDEQENTEGLRCFGFALRCDSPVVDAISCSVPLGRLTAEREAEIITAMEAARTRIEDSAPVTGSSMA